MPTRTRNFRNSFRWRIPAGGILVVAVCLLLAQPVSAHPPASVSPVYHELNGTLDVTITHTVADPKTHYVKNVLIRVNGKDVANETYTGQPTASVFTYRYPLQLRPGDTVEATAFCSITGSTTGTFIAPGPTASGPAAGDAQPTQKSPVADIAPVVAAGLLLILRKNR